MPYKFEYSKLKIPKELDKRIKLDDDERKEIKKLYGKISQRKLAKMFRVSRRLIIFIGDPEKYQRNKEARAERGGSMQYYDKAKHTARIRKFRERKKELYDLNKLGEK